MPLDGTPARSPISPFAILRRAREIIRPRWRWTTDACARTFIGQEVDVTDTRACRFCAEGAIMRAARQLQASEFEETEALRLIGPGLVSLNDDAGHKKVLARFDRAIAGERMVG